MVGRRGRGGDEEEVAEWGWGNGPVGRVYPCVRAEWDGGTTWENRKNVSFLSI